MDFFFLATVSGRYICLTLRYLKETLYMIMLDSQGQLLTDYGYLGLGRQSDVQAEMTTFFGASWYSNGGILLGIKDILASDSMQVQAFGIPLSSSENTNTNKLSIARA